MESSGAAETATTDAASSQGDTPAREPCPPAKEEGVETVKWGQGRQHVATISLWSPTQCKFLGWLSQIKDVAHELRQPVTMPPRPAQPQSSCMMQLPHAYSLRLGKCNSCGQEHTVRQ
eukprot:8911320-Heterocapsa_arctica.AAC.1